MSLNMAWDDLVSLLRFGSTVGTAAAERLAWVQRQLGGLKERHRRALTRFVEQQMRKRQGSAQQALAHSDSEDEGDEGDHAAPKIRGGRWPEDVVYSNDYQWDRTGVPSALAAKYRPPGAPRRRPARPSPRCYGARITEEGHPACGQNGLHAAVDLARGAWVLDYAGRVTLKSAGDAASEYACEFGEKGELTLDATHWGNEARLINDYRNTGRAQNVEFRLRRDRRGELRQGVYVTAKHGVRTGEELLVSYGAGFWRARIEGSMDDFVYRYVGQPGQCGQPPTTKKQKRSK
eukprot:g5245.t1